MYAVRGCYPFVYKRPDSNGRFYVAVNPSEQSLTLDLPELENAATVLSLGGQLQETKLLMPGVSSIVLKLP